jgi:hypothetical protein
MVGFDKLARNDKNIDIIHHGLLHYIISHKEGDTPPLLLKKEKLRKGGWLDRRKEFKLHKLRCLKN